MAINVMCNVGVVDLFAPLNTRLEGGYIVGAPHPAGGISLERIAESRWGELPHVALANLPTYNEQRKLAKGAETGLWLDPGQVERFVRTYGGFAGAVRPDEKGDVTFKQELSQVAKYQESLRRAWTFKGYGTTLNNPDSLSSIGEDLKADGMPGLSKDAAILVNDPRLGADYWDLLHVRAELGWKELDGHQFIVHMFSGQRHDEVLLQATDLWKFISYLFLCDFVAKRTGVCGNPDCPDPYYLKRQTGQKVCQEWGCAQYAHRLSATKWWHEIGQKRRTKKRAISPRKKRK